VHVLRLSRCSARQRRSLARRLPVSGTAMSGIGARACGRADVGIAAGSPNWPARCSALQTGTP